MKAYIISADFEQVQIGGTIFQPCTGIKYGADRKGLEKYPSVEVKKASMREARKALLIYKNIKTL